jgi:hypothetical protein
MEELAVDHWMNDVVKCQLKPMSAVDYRVPLSPAELSCLRHMCPTVSATTQNRAWNSIRSMTHGCVFGPSPANRATIPQM